MRTFTSKVLLVLALFLLSAPTSQANRINWRNLRCGEYEGSNSGWDSSWSDVSINFHPEHLIMKWDNKSLKLVGQRERGGTGDVSVSEVKDQYNRTWTIVVTQTMEPEYFRFWMGRPNPDNPGGVDIYILCKDRRSNNW